MPIKQFPFYNVVPAPSTAIRFVGGSNDAEHNRRIVEWLAEDGIASEMITNFDPTTKHYNTKLVFRSSNYPITVHAGDWIVRFAKSQYATMSDEHFAKMMTLKLDSEAGHGTVRHWSFIQEVKEE